MKKKNFICFTSIWILILFFAVLSFASLSRDGGSQEGTAYLARENLRDFQKNTIVIPEESVATSDHFEATSEALDATPKALDATADTFTETASTDQTTDSLYAAIPATACIIKDPEVSEGDYALALQLFDALPSRCKQSLYENEWSILLSGSTLSERRNVDYSILGTTVYDEKQIYLDHRTKAITYALYHEIGHAIAEINDQADCTPEFYSIYEEEKDTLVDVHETGDRHCATCASEYFATIVDNILTSKDAYEYTAPKGYAYVKQFL